MTTFSSPRDLAVYLESLAGHLYAHPHLPHIDHIDRGYEAHISSNPSLGPVGAEAVVLWADTLIDAGIEVRALEPFTDVAVIGCLGDGTKVRVWAADRGPVHRWAAAQTDPGSMPSGIKMSLAELKALVAQQHQAVSQ